MITDSDEVVTGCRPCPMLVNNIAVRSKADRQHSARYNNIVVNSIADISTAMKQWSANIFQQQAH